MKLWLLTNNEGYVTVQTQNDIKKLSNRLSLFNNYYLIVIR